MNKRGFTIVELILSFGMISLITINALVMLTSLVKRNNEIYQKISKNNKINQVYSTIGLDFYRNNIKYTNNGSNNYTLQYYTLDKNSKFNSFIKIVNNNIVYGSTKTIYSNKYIKFNSVEINEIESGLNLSITYNDDKHINIYSVNYKR